mmetsp:Transcript_11789/g.16910  ORF Transcript_11789/g.16910 Transcript_11789/m.16910 type:complete len:335 (+) Transcript_11789:920-1924(+)
MVRTPDCPRCISEKFINQVFINSLLIVNVTCPHHVTQDTMDSLQNSIRLWIFDRSGLTFDGIRLQESSKVFLELRTIITQNLRRPGIPTQPSFIEELGDARRSPIQDFIFNMLNLTLSLLKFTVNRNSGKFNHLKPTRRRVNHSHAHKLDARLVLSLDRVGANKVDTDLLPWSYHCCLRRKLRVLAFPPLSELTSLAVFRKLLNISGHSLPIHYSRQSLFQLIPARMLEIVVIPSDRLPLKSLRYNHTRSLRVSYKTQDRLSLQKHWFNVLLGRWLLEKILQRLVYTLRICNLADGYRKNFIVVLSLMLSKDVLREVTQNGRPFLHNLLIFIVQ